MSEITKWQDYIRQHPPRGANSDIKKRIRAHAREHYWVQHGDSCFVCDDDRIEILRKHHLLPVGKFAERQDINNHLLCLCESCHSLAHMLIYGDRQGVSWQTVQRLKESGHWVKFVEIDRIAVEAARGVVSEYSMKGGQDKLTSLQANAAR